MTAPQPPERPPRAAGSVQSVERALDVLETLAERGRPLGISDIAAATGLPYGTVHRLLRTLVLRGYARQDGSRKYALGAELLRLADAANRDLAAAARPFLVRLVGLTGETANLALLEGDHVVYVAQAPSPHRLRMFAEVGRRVAPHSTAVGKVLLAARRPQEVDAILARNGLPRRTERTITTADALHAELERVRARGYAVDDGEEETGVRCVAVPVRSGGAVVAALSVSGPAARIPADVPPRLAGVLGQVAGELAGTLSRG